MEVYFALLPTSKWEKKNNYKGKLGNETRYGWKLKVKMERKSVGYLKESTKKKETSLAM